MTPVRRAALSFLAVSILSLSGCAGLGSNASIVNKQNQFSIAWQVNDHTESKTYNWENNKQYARISFSSQVTAGTLTFKMFDKSNSAVCTVELTTASTNSGVAITKAAGQAGTWKITFELRRMSGNVGASIEASDGAAGTETVTCL